MTTRTTSEGGKFMRRRSNFAATAMSLLLVAFLAGDALGQTAKQPFVGSWTIVSADTVRPDGTRVPNFGSGPKGFLVFDGSGRYALQIMSANRAKFASNNRLDRKSTRLNSSHPSISYAVFCLKNKKKKKKYTKNSKNNEKSIN